MPPRLAAVLLLAACSAEPSVPSPDAEAPDATPDAVPCSGACGAGTVCELGRCVAVIGPDAAHDVAADVALEAGSDAAAEAAADAADAPALDAPPVACDAGFTRCGDRCVDTTSDRDNCGGCSRQCLPNPDRHFHGVCAANRCASRCDVGWGDCNADLNDGCEASLNRLNRCGACAVQCRRDGVCARVDGGYACR